MACASALLASHAHLRGGGNASSQSEWPRDEGKSRFLPPRVSHKVCQDLEPQLDKIKVVTLFSHLFIC
eukprot:764027-Hanusia_phi.AAC.8